MNIGGGSSSTSVEMTEEQKQILATQAEALKNVFMPAYKNTTKNAEDVYGTLSPYVNKAALGAYNTYGDVAGTSINAAKEAYGGGMDTLKQLFDPNYEKNQVNAALQAGREATREQLGQQNAMYGAAGGLGSSRQALADTNLRQLGEQRQATAAAGAQAQVQQNRMAAAGQMLGAGQSLANLGLSATGQQLSAAQSPMDLYSKYASIIYGVPQASTTPNFAGTQGSSTSGYGFGMQGSNAASIFGGSDISIKENIKKIGTLENGLPLYKFEYKDQYKDTWGHGQQIGVMAQDVEKVMPEAVAVHPDGYKMVNYAMVM